MRPGTIRDDRKEGNRKATRLSLHRETLHNLSEGDSLDPDRGTHACTGTCIITGHPCPPPCG